MFCIALESGQRLFHALARKSIQVLAAQRSVVTVSGASRRLFSHSPFRCDGGVCMHCQRVVYAKARSVLRALALPAGAASAASKVRQSFSG